MDVAIQLHSIQNQVSLIDYLQVILLHLSAQCLRVTFQ